MTREENIRAILESNFAGYKEEVIDIAVKRICELEQEPKTDGDCISREKTLEKFCDYVGSGMSMDDFDALYDIVSKMPSVQPKTGHWVLDGSDNSLECINCGCVIYANDIMRGEPHYCPNCGRRMSEVSE